MVASAGTLDALLGLSFLRTDISAITVVSYTTTGSVVALDPNERIATATIITTAVASLGGGQQLKPDFIPTIVGIGDSMNTISILQPGTDPADFISDFVIGYNQNALLISMLPSFNIAAGLDFHINQDAILYVLTTSPVAVGTTLSFTADGSFSGAPTQPPPPIPPTGIVTVQGSHDQYLIANNGGSLYVQDTIFGRDGTQSFPGDNVIKFTDGTGVFDPTGAAEDVTRIYLAALGRGPDLDGLEFWTSNVDDASVPLSAVANALSHVAGVYPALWVAFRCGVHPATLSKRAQPTSRCRRIAVLGEPVGLRGQPRRGFAQLFSRL